MDNLFSRALVSGLGLASLTKEALQKSVQDLVNQSKLSEEEGKRVIKDLHRRSAQAQKSMETKIHAQVGKVLKQFNLKLVKNTPQGGKTTKKAAAPRKRRRSGRASKARSR
jgi:polyhydroxyalkanoate synthesis regulator phasin